MIGLKFENANGILLGDDFDVLARLDKKHLTTQASQQEARKTDKW